MTLKLTVDVQMCRGRGQPFLITYRQSLAVCVFVASGFPYQNMSSPWETIYRIRLVIFCICGTVNKSHGSKMSFLRKLAALCMSMSVHNQNISTNIDVGDPLAFPLPLPMSMMDCVLLNVLS